MYSTATIYRFLVESGLKTGNWTVFSGGGGGIDIQEIQLAKVIEI